MKKIIVFFALSWALIFVVSCGGSSKTGDTTDTGETVADNDGDSGDSEPADDSEPSGDTDSEDPENPDTTPDNGDTTPDSGDSQPDDIDTTLGQPDNDVDTDSGDSDTDLSDSDSGNSLLDSCPTVDGNMWSPLSSTTKTQQEALDYCDRLSECGHTDWRLPNINDLRTLIQNCPGSQTGGACAVSAPDHLASSDWSEDCECEYKGNNGGYYSKLGDDNNVVWLWSSSTPSDITNYAWYVDFGYGRVSGNNKYYYRNVRCVR